MIPWILTLVLAFGGLGSMPAVVTTPPIIIDAANPVRDDLNGSHYFGPFVIGANQYAVLATNLVPGPGTRFLNVYKSTNSGATWTNLDTANRPALNSGSQEFDCILNGTVLKIVYVVPGANHVARIITFDSGTDTFGAVSVDGPVAHSVKLVQFSSGDVCVWYNQLTLSLCAAVIFSGGAWGAPTTIANSKNNVATAVLGPNNVAQLFYYDTNAPSFNLFFRTFTNPGVMGAEQAVLSSAFLANQNENSVPVGRISIWNGNFKVPYYNAAGHASIFTGAPYTAPVWDAGVLVDTLAWGINEQDSDGFTLIDANNNLILFWNSEDTGNIIPVDQMYYAINSGAGFAAPVLFYDAVANPQLQDPAQTPATQFLHTLSAVRLASGAFAVLTAMEENGFCAGYFLGGGGGGAAAAVGFPGGAGGPRFSRITPRIISKRCQIEAPPVCPSVDLPYSLIYTKALAANTILLDEKQIVGKEWFLLKAISGKSSAPYFVRFVRPDGLEMSSARVHTGVYLNLAGQRLLVDPPILMAPDSWIGVELENQSSAVIAAIITFEGVQRRFFFDGAD